MIPLNRREALVTATGAVFAPEPNHAPAGHVVLLGDSIFDNKRYVGHQDPAVIDQVRAVLPAGWQATLLAVDGSVVASVSQQLNRLPQSTTHVILSVGGNDALRESSGILTRPTRTGTDALHYLSGVRARFEREYGAMLDALVSRGKAVVVCTIYDPNYPEARLQQVSVTGLAIFNDCITRAAFARGIPILDLRILFTAKQDYANPIEPSATGGQKIADQLRHLITGHDFTNKWSTVFPGR